MKRSHKLVLLIVMVGVLGGVALALLPAREGLQYAKPGTVVELVFELDKQFEFGEYYFDVNNGGEATYPLCFCLTEKNTYPPDCSGDVAYLYKNRPGTMCIPLTIGKGALHI